MTKGPRLAFPWIRTRDLRKSGLLRDDPDSEEATVFRHDRHPSFPPGMETVVVWDPVGKTVKFYTRTQALRIEQVFAYELQTIGKCDRYFFVCPKTGNRVSTLYFVDGSFGSRQAKGLRYASQAKAPKPKGAPRARRTYAQASDNGMDTLAGLRQGKTYEVIAPNWSDPEFTDCLPGLCVEDEDRPFDHSVPLDIWENFPRLDLRVLAREGLLRDGKATPVTLAWSRNGRNELVVYLNIDLRSDSKLSVLASGHDREFFQTIALTQATRSRGLRYVMSCPAMLIDVEAMAFRDGRFASRQAQRLVHASQRAAGKRSKAP